MSLNKNKLVKSTVFTHPKMYPDDPFVDQQEGNQIVVPVPQQIDPQQMDQPQVQQPQQIDQQQVQQPGQIEQQQVQQPAQAPPQEQVIDPAPRNLFNRYKVVFSEAKEDGRSEEFIEVKRALSDVLQDRGEGDVPPLSDQICEGSLHFGGDSYAKFLRLSEALTVYYTGHKDASSEAGVKRKEAAFFLRQVLNKAAMRRLEKGNAVPEAKEPVEANPKEKKDAAYNVRRMLKYYQKYCKKLSEDMIATPEEKLRSRWNVFKTCERDILIFLEEADDGYQNDRIYLKNEYDTLRMQLSLCTLAKQEGDNALADDMTNKLRQRAFMEMNGEEAPQVQGERSLDAGDATLTEAQEKGLSAIDAWVLRNIRNGGYMSLGLNTSDRTDFATKLLSMSKRERLYIYYLVETRERIAPEPDGFAKSQTIYEPDLSAFKEHMIASKAKFYTRFSGSYIYWSKLTEAMAIATSAGEATTLMEEIKTEAQQPAAGQQEEGGLAPEEARRRSLKQLLRNLSIAVELAAAKEKSKDEAEKQQLETQLTELSAERNGLMDQFNEIQNQIAAKKGTSKADRKKDIKTYTSTAPTDAATVVAVVKDTIAAAAGTEGTILKAINDYSNVGQSSLSGLGTLMGLVFSAMNLYSGHASMTNLDFIGGLGKAVRSLASIGKSVGTVGKQFSGAAIFEKVTATEVGAGLGYAWIGLAGIKGMSYLKDGSRRKRASKLAKSGQADKYSEGMLKLNRVLGKKQRTNVILEGLSAGTSVTVTSLIGASMLAPAFGVIVSGVLLVSGVVQQIADSKFASKMKRKINEEFFHTEDLANEAETKWNEKHPNRKMTSAQKAKLKMQMEKRMAAELGCYSANHLARSVAEKYANYLLDGAKGADDHAKMCRAMIRGLGLYYKYDDKDPENTVPTVSDIVGKMCG